MTKKMSIALAGSIVLLVIWSGVHASTGDSDDSDHKATVLHLVERRHDLIFQDNGTPGPTLGDRLIFSSDLFDEAGQPVGRDGADCVIVRIDESAPASLQQVVQCQVTVQLSDGQLTFQGLAQGTENFFGLNGGTGVPRGSRRSLREGRGAIGGSRHHHHDSPLASPRSRFGNCGAHKGNHHRRDHDFG
jgi:hypothetical protein